MTRLLLALTAVVVVGNGPAVELNRVLPKVSAPPPEFVDLSAGPGPPVDSLPFGSYVAGVAAAPP